MNSRRLRSSMRLPPQGATVIIRPPAAVLAQSVCRTSSLPTEVSTVFGANLNSESRPVPPELHATRLRCNPNLGILKDGRERSAAAVRERIHPALAIVRDQPPNGHGLHSVCGAADSAVGSGSRDTGTHDRILRAERSRQFFHDLPGCIRSHVITASRSFLAAFQAH